MFSNKSDKVRKTLAVKILSIRIYLENSYPNATMAKKNRYSTNKLDQGTGSVVRRRGLSSFLLNLRLLINKTGFIVYCVKFCPGQQVTEIFGRGKSYGSSLQFGLR